jgi:glucose dehydrogenase
MRNYSLGWSANRRADRKARIDRAAQIFGIALSLVCLWAVWRIGWDFVEHMPSADMGAW